MGSFFMQAVGRLGQSHSAHTHSQVKQDKAAPDTSRCGQRWQCFCSVCLGKRVEV